MRQLWKLIWFGQATAVERHGGFVAKDMGDGVLAYFGHPQAHDDDSEGAVRAGLALVERVPKLKSVTDVALQIRDGIATGLVVGGDLIAAGASRRSAAKLRILRRASRLWPRPAPGRSRRALDVDRGVIRVSRSGRSDA